MAQVERAEMQMRARLIAFLDFDAEAEELMREMTGEEITFAVREAVREMYKFLDEAKTN